MSEFIIEEDLKDFYNNEEIQHKETNKCCLCDEINDTNDLKTVLGYLVCKECEVSEDNISEFGTIENTVKWFVRKGYVK